MGTGLIDDRRADLSASVSYVGSAWLLAGVVVGVLLGVVAPLLGV